MKRFVRPLLLTLALGWGQAQAYELFGASYKWGDKVLGAPGGTVTYSILDQGVLCSTIARDWDLLGRNCVTTSPERSFGTDYARIFGQAFAAWSQWADIDFVQVPDDGAVDGHGDVQTGGSCVGPWPCNRDACCGLGGSTRHGLCARRGCPVRL